MLCVMPLQLFLSFALLAKSLDRSGPVNATFNFAKRKGIFFLSRRRRVLQQSHFSLGRNLAAHSGSYT